MIRKLLQFGIITSCKQLMMYSVNTRIFKIEIENFLFIMNILIQSLHFLKNLLLKLLITLTNTGNQPLRNMVTGQLVEIKVTDK